MRFSIAGIVIEIRNKEIRSITEPFKPFISNTTADYVIDFKICKRLNSAYTVKKTQNDCFWVEQGEIEYRYFFSGDIDKTFYAVGKYDWNHKHADIFYLEAEKRHLNECGNSFFHTALEALLLRENRFILHSCLVDTKYGGILFSGDSGKGKSTQGDLWVKYEHARIINGDRSVLYQDNGKWLAAGSPYAGSSKYYVNESVPVKAVVFLEKSAECSIRRLHEAEAFSKIYRQTTMNTWSITFMTKVSELIEMLICSVPVYELSCTPEKDAVHILKDCLEQESAV